jgi:hypothetical protein
MYTRYCELSLFQQDQVGHCQMPTKNVTEGPVQSWYKPTQIVEPKSPPQKPQRPKDHPFVAHRRSQKQPRQSTERVATKELKSAQCIRVMKK